MPIRCACGFILSRVQTTQTIKINVELLLGWCAKDERAVEILRDSIREPRNRRHIYKLLNRQPLQGFAELVRSLFREEMAYRNALWHRRVEGNHDYFEGIRDCAFLLCRLGTHEDQELISAAGRLNQDVGTLEEYSQSFEDPGFGRDLEIECEKAIDLRTNICTAPYEKVARGWPDSGRHILAHYDDVGVVVYQAYRSSIADFAVANQRFGGDFSLSRMSWIKPSFLWMMYRSGWATKENQERILAIRVKSSFFESLLELAVTSTFDAERYPSYDDWQRAVASSEVRLQWDPDHDLNGHPLARRTLQLGLRGSTLEQYADAAIISIEDITPFAKDAHTLLDKHLRELYVPDETVYVPGAAAAANLGVPVTARSAARDA
jgi:hypothetical protein